MDSSQHRGAQPCSRACRTAHGTTLGARDAGVGQQPGVGGAAIRGDGEDCEDAGRVAGQHQQDAGPGVDVDGPRAEHLCGRRIAEAGEAGGPPLRIVERAVIGGLVEQVEDLRP